MCDTFQPTGHRDDVHYLLCSSWHIKYHTWTCKGLLASLCGALRAEEALHPTHGITLKIPA